jgi:hypothetical protein
VSDVIRVLWTIVPRIAPWPWLACRACGEARPFRSSDRIRLNANGRRLDAWLIYKCMVCETTWNRPVIERRSVRSLDPTLLSALQANDPALVRQLVFDVVTLRRYGVRIEEFADASVRRELLSEGEGACRRLALSLAVPEPVGLRLDRLLATELGVARRRIEELGEKGYLEVSPGGLRELRRHVRDRTGVLLDLASEDDGDAIVTAATGGRAS